MIHMFRSILNMAPIYVDLITYIRIHTNTCICKNVLQEKSQIVYRTHYKTNSDLIEIMYLWFTIMCEK